MPKYTPEQMAAAKKLREDDYLEPELPKLSPEECEQKIQEFLSLVTTFEATHPIQELYAVTELDGKDVIEHPEKYPVRVAAKRDLIPIVATLNFLKERASLSPEKYAELKAHYQYLMRAVGMISNGKVDHTR